MTLPDDPRAAGALQVCAALRCVGHRALLAGGCVRDLILGVAPKDYDIATSARAGEVMALFPRTVAVGAAFGVVVVLAPEGDYEVATFRKDGPYLDGRRPASIAFVDEREDALRRDFTINAMFFDPETGQVLDYVEGQRDLREGVIRTVGDPRGRFQEDHLRLLRAVRFGARLQYRIEPETFDAMRECAPLIACTSAERARDELVRILTEGGAAGAFQMLADTGLLEHVLPEVARMRGVEQPPEFHPEGDVFVHTLLLLEHLQKIHAPSPTLAMAVLLHDAGKPVTQTFEDRIRFNNHDKVGARIAGEICRRLRFSNDETDRIVWLVEQHMRLATIPQMRESKRKRFVREPGFGELLELCRIDCLASHGDTTTVDWVRSYRDSLGEDQLWPEPLLKGGDLIALGYEPGPLFKKILDAVEDLRLEEKLGTDEDARAYVLSQWPVSAPHKG